MKYYSPTLPSNLFFPGVKVLSPMSDGISQPLSQSTMVTKNKSSIPTNPPSTLDGPTYPRGPLFRRHCRLYTLRFAWARHSGCHLCQLHPSTSGGVLLYLCYFIGHNHHLGSGLASLYSSFLFYNRRKRHPCRRLLV